MRVRRLASSLLVPLLLAAGACGDDSDATRPTDQELADRAVQRVTDDLVEAGYELTESEGEDPEVSFDTEACTPYGILFNGGELEGETAFAETPGDLNKANPDGSQDIAGVETRVVGSAADLDPFFALLAEEDFLPCLDEGLRLLFAQIDFEVTELDLEPVTFDDSPDRYAGVEATGTLATAGQSAPFGFSMGIGREDRLVVFALLIVLGNDVASIDSAEVVARALAAA